jgi:hypothetical protein
LVIDVVFAPQVVGPSIAAASVPGAEMDYVISSRAPFAMRHVMHETWQLCAAFIACGKVRALQDLSVSIEQHFRDDAVMAVRPTTFLASFWSR